MPMKSSRPERNACTATSLAAFSTQVAVPPSSAAARASRRQGKASRSGGSNSSAPISARSSVRTGTSTRSGWWSAYAIGTRMSGCPRCASVAPSQSETSAWTIDCGCTTTPIRSYGVPKSQCASITSRPLFISVAESIVILPPIAHVGWRSAASTVTSASWARLRPRNGPPDAVSVSRSTVPGRSPSTSWCSAECSESTGISCAPVASESAITSSPPTTSDSLLASATSTPSVSATIVGPSPAEPTIALSTRSAPDSATSRTSPSGPPSTSPPVHASAARAAASASLSAIRRDQRLVRALRGEPDELERLGRPRDDVERLGADRAGSAEDQEPLHPMSQCGIRPLNPSAAACVARGERAMGGRIPMRRALALALVGSMMAAAGARAQDGPTVVDPRLEVRTAVDGLTTPISIAFLGDDDMFVLEKETGRVKHVVDGVVTGTVLDLAVNNASERGLLGIALHPDFDDNGFVYLYWTESTTGADSNVLSDVPLLGNRVDRFHWNDSTLTLDRNLIRLRALQDDATNGVQRGNHDGGVLRFGADDKHLTGVILRLSDDGTTPSDNPFFAAGAAIGGEVGANVQKIYAYGLRNSFGMAFDPFSGALWEQENGDDSFSEINR